MEKRTTPDLLVWRANVLKRAGFDPQVAKEMVQDGRMDLHAVLTLVDQGCPPVLAARIAGPDD